MSNPSDTGPGGLEHPRKRVNYDPTINLGHILTFSAMLITTLTTGFGLWSVLDKRVVVLERDSVHQNSRDASQDALIRDKFEDIKASIRDIQASVNELNRNERANDRANNGRR